MEKRDCNDGIKEAFDMEDAESLVDAHHRVLPIPGLL
jgi:hypothetical protein